MASCSNNIKRPIWLLFISCISFLLSILIYILFRSRQIRIIGYCEKNFYFLHNLRLELRNNFKGFPTFIFYSLPDGLFLFSYTTLMLWLWHKNKYKFYWVLFLPVFLVIIEFFQLNHSNIGTFDFIDLILYICFVLITLLINSKFLR